MKTCATVDEYIRSFPAPTRKILKQLRAVMRKAAPHASEKISYGIPTLYQDGNLVHYAAYPGHIGLYGAPRSPRALDLKAKKYRTGKGTLQFPIDQPIPLELVRQIVEARVNASRTSASRAARGSQAARGPSGSRSAPRSPRAGA
jgi:uncharacterized protein YdhG (YjbR/CyaY superfamily)